MRISFLPIVLAVAALATVSGCDHPIEPNIVEAPADASEARRELTENRELFRTAVGTSYLYDYRNVCFCAPDSRIAVRVSVRHGTRVSVVALEDDAQIPPSRWREYLTVEEAFETIEQALDDGAASVRAAYDESLGYPRDVFIDFDERIADEEQGFTFDNLAVTP